MPMIRYSSATEVAKELVLSLARCAVFDAKA
jgi:hypothetical protein